MLLNNLSKQPFRGKLVKIGELKWLSISVPLEMSTIMTEASNKSRPSLVVFPLAHF